MRIHIATGDHCIDCRDHIRHVLLAKMEAQCLGECLAIAHGTVRVRVQHEITGIRPRLELVREGVAVLCLWAAMNLQHKRVLLRGVEPWRREQPAVYRVVIRSLHGEPLGGACILAGEEGGVCLGQLPLLPVRTHE